MKAFVPDRVEIVDPKPAGKEGRGPVTIHYNGLVFENCEIDHGLDPNDCSSLVEFPDGTFRYARYSLVDIVGLEPRHLPYLGYNDGVYTLKAIDW